MAETPGLLRQWKILQVLSARRLGVTVQELADDTGVNLRTIRRDLKLFQQLGLPLEEQAGTNGKKFWRIAEEGRLPALQLTVEEAAALYVGQRLLEPLAGTVFWKSSREAFEKIRTRLGPAALRHLEKLAEGFHQTAVGKTDYSSKAELIDQLVFAIEERRLSVLTYQSLRSTEPVTLYDVHPYALVFHKGASTSSAGPAITTRSGRSRSIESLRSTSKGCSSPSPETSRSRSTWPGRSA